MLIQNMTAEQEKWLTAQMTPAPEVIILAFCGTSVKEWKLIAMCSLAEYRKVEPITWEKRATDRYPSALAVKVYVVSAAVPSRDPAVAGFDLGDLL